MVRQVIQAMVQAQRERGQVNGHKTKIREKKNLLVQKMNSLSITVQYMERNIQLI